MEIRTYEGSEHELADFVCGAWRNLYGGRMAIPLWTPEYFAWQVDFEDPVSRNHLIAAYDGSQLVGTILGIPFEFRTNGQTWSGTQGSWLSVHPDYLRRGLGSQMRQEMLQRHSDEGRLAQVGFVFYGSRRSLAPSFWKKQRELGTTILRRAGFWVRVLDADRAAGWNPKRGEALMTRLLRKTVWSPRVGAGSLTIRPFAPGDLDDCVALAQESADSTDLALAWQPKNLLRHLHGGGVGRSLVAADGERIRGFVSYHCLPFLGKTIEPVGVIDLLVLDRLKGSEQNRLLNVMLDDMKGQGAILALRIRLGDVAVRPLIRAGFVPRPADSLVVISWAGEPRPVTRTRHFHLLWR